jgi:outer membrane scaffolding protein for murein synthesis (MipA/OmpV family)
MLRILPRRLGLLWGCAWAACAPAAGAQDDAQRPAETGSASSDAPKPAEPPPAQPRSDIEGAIGPVLGYRPEYQGGSRSTVDGTLGIFLRWGRYTVTNAGGFVTRRDDDVMRGLAADLLRSERTRINLALRIDRGRKANESDALSGLEDIRGTLRGRLVLSHALGSGVGASMGTSVDLLGRGGGTVVDLSVGETFPLAPRATWSLGLAVTGADRRYMQSYFGVTAEQAQRTGYAEYQPSTGWRDISANIGARSEFGERWIGFAGFSVSQLIGPARDSPLSQRASGWAVNGGLAWRF